MLIERDGSDVDGDGSGVDWDRDRWE